MQKLGTLGHSRLTSFVIALVFLQAITVLGGLVLHQVRSPLSEQIAYSHVSPLPQMDAESGRTSSDFEKETSGESTPKAMPKLAGVSSGVASNLAGPEEMNATEEAAVGEQALKVASEAQESAAGQKPQTSMSSEITYQVSSGDTLTQIWTKNGGSYAGGIKAAEAFQEAKVPLSSLRSGENLEIRKGEDGDIVEFRKRLSSGSTLVLKGSSEKGYETKVIKPEIVESMRTVSGTITSSFSHAALQNNVPYEVVDELVDLFGPRVEFRRDMQVGDSFSVIYTERRTRDGEVLSPGPIEAASIKNSGDLLAAVRHVSRDGSPHYFDEQGELLGRYFLRYPVRFTRISSVFNKARFHPVLKVRRPHNGVDFAAPIGTPVRAVADGVVTTAGYRGGNGRMVKIRHGSRWQTAYLHLSKIGKGLRSGSRVKRGQVIGTVGMTGLATGPHLHYSLYDRGNYVDPLKVALPAMPNNGIQIPAQYLKATLRTLKREHNTLQVASSQKVFPHA